MEKIKLQNVKKLYSDTVALNDITLSVAGGNVLGIIGPNGAGKTTLINILVGLKKVTSGLANVCGYNPVNRNKEFKYKISAVLEDPIFLENLFVNEHFKLIGLLYKIKDSNHPLHIMEKWHIDQYKNKKLSTLSKGNRKRVAIATACMRNFEVLIMDEPFKELDIYGRKLLEEEIEKFKQEEKTIIITSHELFQIHKLCDDLALMRNGDIVKQISIAKIQNEIDIGTYKDFEEFVYNSLNE